MVFNSQEIEIIIYDFVISCVAMLWIIQQTNWDMLIVWIFMHTYTNKPFRTRIQRFTNTSLATLLRVCNSRNTKYSITTQMCLEYVGHLPFLSN